MRNKIYILLDILLIIGALIAVATIDGGRYWTTGLAIYQSANAAGYDANSQQIADNASEVSPNKSSQQAKSNCLMYPKLAIPEWAEVNMMIARYNASQTVEDSNGNQTAACK